MAKKSTNVPCYREEPTVAVAAAVAVAVEAVGAPEEEEEDVVEVEVVCKFLGRYHMITQAFLLALFTFCIMQYHQRQWAGASFNVVFSCEREMKRHSLPWIC